jgi:hypothetical protein
MCWQGTHKQTDGRMEKKKLSLSEADDTTSKFTPRKKNIVTFLLLQFFPTSEILTVFFECFENFFVKLDILQTGKG